MASKLAFYALIGALLALGLRFVSPEILATARPMAKWASSTSPGGAQWRAVTATARLSTTNKAETGYSLDVFKRYAPPPKWFLGSSVVGPAFVSVEVADFTGDRRADIVTLIASASAASPYLLHVLPQLASGELGEPLAYPLSSVENGPYNNFPFATAAGDFNEDGIMDLVLTRGRSISLLTADGKGGFRNNSYGADRAFDVASVVLDVNRDGHLDVVSHSAPDQGETLDSRSRLVIHYGDGLGGIAGHSNLYTFGSVQYDSEKAHSMATGDLNSDGHPDLVLNVTEFDYRAQVQRRWLLVHLHDGQQGFRPALRINSALTTGSEALALKELIVADFTRDGLDDLVATAESFMRTEVHVYPQKADGTLDMTPRVKSAYHSATALEAGDLDNDGYFDLLVAHSTQNRIGYLLQGQDGLQDEVFRDVTSGAPGISPTGQAIGDLNGDGCADAVVVSQWENMTVLHGSGCSVRVRVTGGNSRATAVNGTPQASAASPASVPSPATPAHRDARPRARSWGRISSIQ